MNQYARKREEGLIAINLKDGDSLIAVKRVSPGENVVMVSSAGKAIVWNEEEARAMGRDTTGVKGMNVGEDEHVLDLSIAKEGADLFVITEKGYGKRTKLSEYPIHHRGGQGVYTITMTLKKGQMAAMKVVTEDDQLIIISEEGVVVRTPAKGVSELGRATQGVRVMNVAAKDKVTAVGIVDDGNRRRKRVGSTNDDLDVDLD